MPGWKNIAWGELIVGALLATAGGVAVYYFTAEAPKLVYEEFPPARFTSQAAEVSIYNVAVDNIGNKEATDVRVHLVLPVGIAIQELQVKPSSIAIDYEVVSQDGSNSKQIRFPLLNAGEGAKFSILANKGDEAELTVEVRGTGAVGHIRDRDNEGVIGASRLTSVLGAVAALVLVLLTSFVSKKTVSLEESLRTAVSQQLRALRTQQNSPPKNSISEVLLGSRWRLFYNPSVPGKSKPVVFREGGKISEGNNHNEATWRVRNDFLELVDSKGEVHSRFYYSPADKRFYHTNDPDTGSITKHGIRDQFIVPESP